VDGAGSIKTASKGQDKREGNMTKFVGKEKRDQNITQESRKGVA